MNIFLLDQDLERCAAAHCDRHVVKMPLEAAQIASTGLYNSLRYSVKSLPYAPTHVNHPICVWAGRSQSHIFNVLDYGLALCYEYTTRYLREHASQKALLHLMSLSLCTSLADLDGSLAQWKYRKNVPQPLCMPDQYKRDDPVVAYRLYYSAEKANIAEWRYTNPPEWWPFEEAEK